MSEPTHEEIVRRADRLWEQAGKPRGRYLESYYRAKEELCDEDKFNTSKTREATLHDR